MKLTRHGFSYLLISLAVLVCVSQAQEPAGDDSFGKSIQPFFAKNCYACHNSKLKVAGFDLEQYQTAASVAQDRGPWASILEKLHNGQMPPKGAPQAAPADVKSITAWIEGEFDRADGAVKPSPGRVTARRLNRAEYNNTIRDLLGVDFRPADDFPQDDSGYGFDVIGDVLSLSPVLMEKYLSAAEKVVNLALFGPGKVAPTAVLHQPPYRAAIDGGDASRFGLPPYTVTNYDLTGLSHPSALHTMHTFPVEGLYEFRISPEGNRPRPSDPFPVVLWIDGKPAHTLQLHGPDPYGAAVLYVYRTVRNKKAHPAGLPSLPAPQTESRRQSPSAGRPASCDARWKRKATYASWCLRLAKREIFRLP